MEDEENRRCTHCHSQSLRVDWAQGDRVCTNCGVVDEEHVRDDRPEWRDYNDAEDVIKGRPPPARCGMVPVDEQKYFGGLQPTTLSKAAFGASSIGPIRASEEKVRKKLMSTNRKLDHMMIKKHSKAMRQARVSRKARLRGQIYDETDEPTDIRPEHDQLVLQEEEEAERAQAILQAEKWSLGRAILLHGTAAEQTGESDLEADRDDLLRRMDSRLKRAASDLYTAYNILRQSAQKLNLPDRVSTDATNTLCEYASQKDGFLVRGIASRLTTSSGSESPSHQKEALEKLREYNKLKQISSLGAALLYLTGRKHGCSRSLKEVCSVFPHPQSPTEEGFIKPKHCSKAMNELRSQFPDFVRSAGTYVAAHTDNFVEHTTRKLDLPPVATACVRTLVKYCQDTKDKGLGVDGGKLSTTCASLAYFVCLVGEIMQRLARQSQSNTTTTKVRKRAATQDSKKSCTKPNNDHQSGRKRKAFDVFSHDAVTVTHVEKTQYEMRRIWDAWSEQMTWTRPISHIEQSCGVSRSVILECYRTRLFPNRQRLLDVLCDSVKSTRANKDNNRLRDTPMAQALLSNVTTASALMHDKG